MTLFSLFPKSRRYFYKQIIFEFARPILKLNGILFTLFKFKKLIKTRKELKIHLGSGRNYLKGWLNIDANIITGKSDIQLDLRNKLPFPDESISAVYSHHVIEHLPDMNKHIKDVYKVLKPKGIYRLAGPNGDSAIKKFIEKDYAWFGDWPDKFESIGGRLSNFLLCGNDHLSILTFSYIEELAKNAGFKEIKLYLPIKETGDFNLFEECLKKEKERDYENPHTLVMELIK